MMLVEQTPVADAVLPLAQLKQQLRLASGFADAADQDGLLLRCLRAAMAVIEARTGKILITRDFIWTVTAWRDPARQKMPIAPVLALTALARITADGQDSALPLALCAVVPDPHRPALVARAGGLLPAVPPHGAIRIGLRAGFGPDWADLPADLAQASLLLAAHHYDCRFDLPAAALDLPAAVLGLTDRHRPLRLGGAS